MLHEVQTICVTVVSRSDEGTQIRRAGLGGRRLGTRASCTKRRCPRWSRDPALVWFRRRINSVWTMSIERFLVASSVGQDVVSIPSASENRPSNTAGSPPVGGTVTTRICSAGR